LTLLIVSEDSISDIVLLVSVSTNIVTDEGQNSGSILRCQSQRERVPILELFAGENKALLTVGLDLKREMVLLVSVPNIVTETTDEPIVVREYHPRVVRQRKSGVVGQEYSWPSCRRGWLSGQ